MSKENISWLGIGLFVIITAYLQQSADTAKVVSPLKIESVEIKRINWESVQIIPDYTLDFVSANFGFGSDVKETITVHDSKDNLIYKGINQRSISIPDNELGNKEELSVTYCLTKSGKTVCEKKKIFASPKHLSINPTITYPHNNRIFLGKFDLKPVLEREIYGQKGKMEILNINVKKLTGSLILKNNKESISIEVKENQGIFDLSIADSYIPFKKSVQQEIYNGNLNINFETIVEITGGIKAAHPKDLLDDEVVNTEQFETEGVPEITSAKIADNTVKELVPVELLTDVKIVPKTIGPHVPVEKKYNLPKDIPAHKIIAYDVPINKEIELEAITPTPVRINEPPEAATSTLVGLVPGVVEPAKKAKTIKKNVVSREMAKDYNNIANKYANAIQGTVIRMVHQDPILTKKTTVKSWRQNKTTGRITIELTIEWIDRWMEDNYKVDGLLTVDEDGKNASFKLISKNQTVKDLENFTAEMSKESFYVKSL